MRAARTDAKGNLFGAMCGAAGLPLPVSEYRFAPPRRWRFDWAWPDYKIALEVEGGAFIRGRHTRGVGYLADMTKYNAAAMMGWRVLRYPPDLLRSSLDDLKMMMLYSGIGLDRKLDTLARIGRYPVIEAT